MKVTLINTSKIIEFNGIPARIWEGTTDTGIKVTAYVTRISISQNEDPSAINQFQNELNETHAPSAEVAAIPLRLIL